MLRESASHCINKYDMYSKRGCLRAASFLMHQSDGQLQPTDSKTGLEQYFNESRCIFENPLANPRALC